MSCLGESIFYSQKEEWNEKIECREDDKEDEVEDEDEDEDEVEDKVEDKEKNKNIFGVEGGKEGEDKIKVKNKNKDELELVERRKNEYDNTHGIEESGNQKDAIV